MTSSSGSAATPGWRLRQVALLAADETAVAAEICDEFGLHVAYRDPGLAQYGMRNAMVPVGTEFLEIAAPAGTEVPAARYLDRAGAGGYVVLLQTDDLRPAVARLDALGVEVTRRIEHDGAIELHLNHRHVGGVLLSLDESNPPEEWPFAGPEWRAHVCTDVVDGFAGLDVACADPQAVGARWAAVLDLPVVRAADGAWVIELRGADVRFVQAADGAGDRLTGVRLRSTDGASACAVTVGATILRAVPR